MSEHTPPAGQLDQFRTLLPTIDPAALTTADRLALLELLRATFEAAGIQ